MDGQTYRLLQIFNRTIGGGGEAVAVEEIERILRQSTPFQDCTFFSKDWAESGSPAVWKQALFSFYNPHSVERIRRLQADLHADAWILHNFVPVASPGVHVEALRQQIPIIQYIHNFRPFSVSSYLWSGRTLDIRRWPTNFLREIRYGAWQESKLKTAFLASVFASMHVLKLFRSIKAWIAVSDFMRNQFIAAGVSPEIIFRIYNPWQLRNVDEPRFTEGNYYIFLGRLMEEKGIKVLVDAWNRLQKEHPTGPKLVIGGDGPLAAWVKKAAEQNPLIDFRGFISGLEKAQLLQGCRALIAPSIWWDPLPFTVYDAYDYGKPVLAAASGGLMEMVQPHRTGLQHRPGNSDHLMEQVLELDRSQRNRQEMGVEGRKWLLANTNDAIWKEQFFKVVDFVTKRS